MSFLKVGQELKPKQRLYLMEITLPSGLTVVKIGKASGLSSVARMMQIIESIYNKFRRTPMIYLKRDREVPTDKVFEYETRLHQYFRSCQYTTTHKWSGHTEAFCIPLEDAVMAYEAVIAGEVPDHTYELPDDHEDKLPF